MVPPPADGARAQAIARGSPRRARPGSRQAVPVIGEAAARELIAVANRKGKTADLKGFLEAIGCSRRTRRRLAPQVAGRVAKRLEGLPDLFYENGEALVLQVQGAARSRRPGRGAQQRRQEEPRGSTTRGPRHDGRPQGLSSVHRAAGPAGLRRGSAP